MSAEFRVWRDAATHYRFSLIVDGEILLKSGAYETQEAAQRDIERLRESAGWAVVEVVS